MENSTTIAVLIFHIPTKAELTKGTKVAYLDAFGQYHANKLGTIQRQYVMDNTELYDVDGFAYTADELRLIKEA